MCKKKTKKQKNLMTWKCCMELKNVKINLMKKKIKTIVVILLN